MQDFSDFIDECERAPRLNELAGFFSSTASGISGMPLQRPAADQRLLPRDALTKRFIRLHDSRQGPFDQHYLSSIPYRLEEECRLGCAILRYAGTLGRPLKLYSLGTAEGTMARSVSELGDGSVLSLSCSPNIENQRSFYAHGAPPYATFFHGPFHHLRPDVLSDTSELRHFADGFDVILEDTTFQMYSPNRDQQVAFVSRHLMPDGIFVFVEKFRHDDVDEYRQRELQKDYGFKARYFRYADILEKEKTVLRTMNENEVTLDQMSGVLKKFFAQCFVTWNSGNFYTLAASNNGQNLQRFVGNLDGPALPSEYVYAHLPHRLF